MENPKKSDRLSEKKLLLRKFLTMELPLGIIAIPIILLALQRVQGAEPLSSILVSGIGVWAYSIFLVVIDLADL